MVRKLLTIGHSYCVTLNRRLAHELALVGRGRWDVTVAGPAYFRGDLRPIIMKPGPDESCRVVPIPARFTGRVHIMSYGSQLKRVLREGWDIVHAWEEPFIFSGGQIAWNKPRGAKLVYATFQNIEKRYPPPFSMIENYSMRRADAWIAFANLVEKTLAPKAIYARRPHRTIPVGVDVKEFRYDHDRRSQTLLDLNWRDDGTCVIGYLGRLVPEKGIRMLMSILDRLKSPWRAMFIGTGVCEVEVRQWMKTHEDRVRLITTASHDQVPAFLNACDLLAAPSQSTPQWREQLGRMLLEGMASGVPVLGSDSGEIPHVLGDAGMVIGESDEKGWEEAICSLMENPGQRQEIGMRGRDRALQEFAWSVVAKRHLNFFEELL